MKNFLGRNESKDRLVANYKLRIITQQYQIIKAERQTGLLIWLLSLAVTMCSLVFLGLIGFVISLLKR